MAQQRWIDLAAHGIYLGDQPMADGKRRLMVVDQGNLGDAARLAEIGLLPVRGSPRYDRGVYYLAGDDQRLRPKSLAAAFGIEQCPIVDVEAAEIERVFREQITAKFIRNLNELAERATPLGTNRGGQHVLQGADGRYIRTAPDRAISETSQQGQQLGRAAFLRAESESELRACAEGFLWSIRQGEKKTWDDVKRFGKVVFGAQATDEQLHRMQEAVEAAAYRSFASTAKVPNDAALRAATELYYALPAARMRTAESVYLQQYSTPLPMSVLAQRLLLGRDETAGKTVLEPTAGNGGLLNLMPRGMDLFATELDPKRLAALQETRRIQARIADATEARFRGAWPGTEGGFDYTIANPPFGQMPTARSFDKLPRVRKVDHYIALRALEARKDVGRSVLIFGADSRSSDGTIEGSTQAFLNYLYDHYEVHGLVEADGRMYTRNGAGLNVRMMVIGDKRDSPIEATVPEKLPIMRSYDELAGWVDRTIEVYSAPRVVVARDAVNAAVLGAATAAFGGDGLAMAEREPTEVERARLDGPALSTESTETPSVEALRQALAQLGKEPAATLGVERPVSATEKRVLALADELAKADPSAVLAVLKESGPPGRQWPRYKELANALSMFGQPLMTVRGEIESLGAPAYVRRELGLLVDQIDRGARRATALDEAGAEALRQQANRMKAAASELRAEDGRSLASAGAVMSALSDAQEVIELYRSMPERLWPMAREAVSRAEGAMRADPATWGEMPAPAVDLATMTSADTAADTRATAIEDEVIAAAADQPLQPWQMTAAEWDHAMSDARQRVQGVSVRTAPSDMTSGLSRMEELRYGVTDWASERMRLAQRGELALTPGELEEITERLNTSVTHRDVVEKALLEGQLVPGRALEGYPDLTPRAGDAESERASNSFQVPYQPASKSGDPSAMVPINMAGSTYAALADLEVENGPIDEFVARKLQYDPSELHRYFSPEQVDALGLAIRSVGEGRGIINADQTGMGKGRWVAAMLRYAKLEGKLPIFLTIKPELFTDLHRDIADIGSSDMFKQVFIFNDGENVKRFGSESEVLYRATTPQERKAALESGAVPEGTDLVMATYSQFQRAHYKNPKAGLLSSLASQNGMLLLDEAHVASGASNLGATVGEAVANADAVLYASATPLKGVQNFAIYSKVFPASVDLMTLPDTLKSGGEALQEAISANMARDGVLIRREHDFSQLTFHMRTPSDDRRDRNIELANELSSVLSGLSYLAGDVAREVAEMNKAYKAEWEDIPIGDRDGKRMQASSMNFGSRLYALNRQFLLGIKLEEAIDSALDALSIGRKPVIAVENTGESLLRTVIARRAGIEAQEEELQELDEKGKLTPEEQTRRAELVSSINLAMRNVVLDEPPQFRELLEVMLDRIGVITEQGRYGDVSKREPESEEYAEAEEALRERIRAFPDLPLTAIDLIRKSLADRGHPVGEVSGRTASIIPSESGDGQWDVRFHPKADAVANVAAFQNGKYDAIIITRSGSTGISLHATDRFEDSDIRQREFIVYQKAANIAEFLQWMGRVNRKDQVVPPVITTLESGLPAELRLTMMHNAKLRKLSANTTSNRDNANLEGEDCDLLNNVGDQVALQWLIENPDVAKRLDIELPNDEDDAFYASQTECPYINKLLGRLMMVKVSEQESILKTLTQRFVDRIEELEQRGENPFKVDVFEWGAETVKEEELQSGVIRETGSSFDEPVKLATLQYVQDVYPIRSKQLLDRIEIGLATYPDKEAVRATKNRMLERQDAWVREHLPQKLRESEASLSTILADEKAPPGAKGAKERADWLRLNLSGFKPGLEVKFDDMLRGERTGVITGVSFPTDKDDLFLLSKYRMRVAFPGEDREKEITLATVKAQGKDLGNGTVDLAVKREDQNYYARRLYEERLAAFDAAPDGKVTRSQLVLKGNIFRACELASSQRLGSPILYTDAQGNRQRAVFVKEHIGPEAVKALPIGLDAADAANYVAAFARHAKPAGHGWAGNGATPALQLFTESVKDLKPGDGVSITVTPGRSTARLSMPGTKAKAGALMTDGAIFDIGEKTPPGSLRLKLTGNRAEMRADVPLDQLGLLLQRMQGSHHAGKFYVPCPDNAIIQELKDAYRAEQAARNRPTADAGLEPA